ncbi:peroxiredoxin-4 isoform X1 [Falco peregrinus]|uniref:peroxiredoxin-4 isoform X1 n=1 Tax=Falco peregrinus TaxID=8954 RepID=UPI00247985A7|nr:peroxiredoxin-4 isoform X1 [Falco peregrinus]
MHALSAHACIFIFPGSPGKQTTQTPSPLPLGLRHDPGPRRHCPVRRRAGSGGACAGRGSAACPGSRLPSRGRRGAPVRGARPAPPSRRGGDVHARRVMEAARRQLRAGGGARGRRGAVLLLLLAAAAALADEAEEPRTARQREGERCHYYAGGQVYPGEAARVPVSDHSLHLSQAKISKPAPYWEGTAVINGEFKELKLTDYEGKYLVFFFYPLDFTFVCPTEIIAFSDRIEEFRAINTEVVACSVDSKFTHLAWINTPRKQGGLGPIRIPLLSDLTHQISKDYGVYLEDQGHTLRGLFIVDDKRILRQITMNDLPVGRSVDETLRLVQAFQYTDKRGEVCPAGWKPGSETIIPDPAGKLKYFDKLN